MREFSSGIHPTVFISNHTFTDEGLWLRQPGFDATFFPQDSIGATTPDEAAMKDLGDDMEGATGWHSERGYETLGDITGATEDWNYFAQGSYGYTPEVRGPELPRELRGLRGRGVRRRRSRTRAKAPARRT